MDGIFFQLQKNENNKLIKWMFVFDSYLFIFWGVGGGG